jgi:subtilase family protein
MHKKLCCFFLAFLLFSMHANAMEQASPNFNDDIFVTMVISNFSSMEEIYSLRLVSRAWYKFLLSDVIWKHIYSKKRHTEEKIIKEKTYKQNCFIPVFISHVTSAVKRDYPYISAIAFKEFISNDAPYWEECSNILMEAFNLYPQVYCSCYTLYRGQNKMNECVVNALNIAKERDILVILPAGNDAEFCSTKATGIDLHEEYPNVMWVTSCTAEKTFNEFSNVGGLVDVAVEGTTGAISVLSFSKSAIDLRKLRPCLTAPQIRRLILKTAVRTEESKEGQLQGGFFDFDAAKKAVLEFDFYDHAPENAKLKKD